MTATDSGLSSLVTQLGRARASAMDVPVVLGSVCSALPGVLGVAGALLLLVDPPDGVPELTASDAHAVWIGETQQRTNMGPLAGALRTWRPMLTTDLSRIGPPTVAGAAAEYGLASSLVLPFDVDGDRVGVLQLLGEVQRPVEAVHAEMLRPLLDVLGARLADVRALRRAGASPPADPAAACTAAPDPTPSSDRIAPTAPDAARSVVDGAAHRPTSDNATSPRQEPASPLVPAPPATPAGKYAGDKRATGATRRSRTAAHAAPQASSPSESTTSVLPSVPPRPGGSTVRVAPPEPASSEVRQAANPPPPTAPRPGKHSV